MKLSSFVEMRIVILCVLDFWWSLSNLRANKLSIEDNSYKQMLYTDKNIYLVTIGIESCLLVCVTSCLLGRTILLNICISANVFVLIIYVRMLDQMLSWLLPACHISFVLSITIVTLHYHGVQYTFLILPPSSRSQNHKLDAVAVLF